MAARGSAGLAALAAKHGVDVATARAVIEHYAPLAPLAMEED